MEADKAKRNFVQAWISGSVKGLLGAVKAYYGRKVVKAYALWRYNSLVLPNEDQKRLRNSIGRIKMQILKLVKLIRIHIREDFQDSFWKIWLASQAHKKETEEKSHYKQDKPISNHTKVRFIQDELDLILLLGIDTEEGRVIQEAVHNNTYLNSAVHENNKQAESWISQRIEELKTENLKISQRISVIDNNISTFISEIKVILKFSDFSKSQKRNIPCPKSTDNNS